MQLITREHVAFQEAHMQALTDQITEAMERGDRDVRNINTMRWTNKGRAGSPALERAIATPFVDRWMDLDCKIIDPKTGLVTETITVQRRSRQLIKKAKKNGSGRNLAPMNTIVVDVWGEKDPNKEYNSPQGYRLTNWDPVHGQLTREERKAINARRKAARAAAKPVQSPAKSRTQQIKELSEQIAAIAAAIAAMPD